MDEPIRRMDVRARRTDAIRRKMAVSRKLAGARADGKASASAAARGQGRDMGRVTEISTSSYAGAPIRLATRAVLAVW